MNDSTFTSDLPRLILAGTVSGLLFGLFTIGLMRTLARRSDRYIRNYIPVSLHGHDLKKYSLVFYPVLFLMILITLYLLKIVH